MVKWAVVSILYQKDRNGDWLEFEELTMGIPDIKVAEKFRYDFLEAYSDIDPSNIQVIQYAES